MRWVHKHSKSAKTIVDFVNSMHPKLDGIQGGLSNGRDFHVWVREGDNGNKRYELKTTGGWTDSSPQDLETMLETGRITLLSFNMENPPCFWYFEEVTT